MLPALRRERVTCIDYNYFLPLNTTKPFSFYANRKKALDRYDSDTNSKKLIISPDSALNHMGIFQNMFLNDKRKKIMKLKMPYVGMT